MRSLVVDAPLLPLVQVCDDKGEATPNPRQQRMLHDGHGNNCTWQCAKLA